MFAVVAHDEHPLPVLFGFTATYQDKIITNPKIIKADGAVL